MNGIKISDNTLAGEFKHVICHTFCDGRDCQKCPAHNIDEKTYSEIRMIRELFKVKVERK